MTDDRISLTIPYPSYIPRARGIHAVAKFGTQLIAKVSKADFDLVDEAAAKTGVKRAEFVRWCAVQTAREVLKHVEPEPDPT